MPAKEYRSNIPQLTGESVISEVLARYPEAAQVMMEAGMHCLGCISATYETIREAYYVHGLDPAEVLEQINSALDRKD